MKPSKVVSRKAWLQERLRLLAQEKAHSRTRDEITRARQALPWVKVEKDYQFEGAHGSVRLADLFDGRGQLIVQHFMFDPEWDEGCKSCSFMADHIDPSLVHIAQRDVAFAAVSKAPFDKLDAFKKRMRWQFAWVSSEKSDFNRDFRVSFTQDELANNNAYYNYRDGVSYPAKEAPGMSTFAKDDDGQVYHTYSVYGRGLENVIGAYVLLDMVPKGRDEDNLPYSMEWLRHKDNYQT